MLCRQLVDLWGRWDHEGDGGSGGQQEAAVLADEEEAWVCVRRLARRSGVLDYDTVMQQPAMVVAD